MTEDEFKDRMLTNLRLAKINNYQTEEKINKSFKVKEIKRLKEENKKTNVKLILGVGTLALATATFLFLILDSKELPKEDIVSKIYSFLRVVIATMGVRIFGIIIKEIINKCKVKGIIEYLENIDKINEDEKTLDENFEEEMKRS